MTHCKLSLLLVAVLIAPLAAQSQTANPCTALAGTIWGWSDPGDTVRVQVGKNTATGTAGLDRRWQVKIQPPAPGGSYTVKIAGHQSVELHNVLVGDVWLCGGQSNMGLPLRFTNNAEEEIKAANYPDIRFYTMTKVAAKPSTRGESL